MERSNPTEEIRTNREIPLIRKIRIALQLSLPIILAQLTVIAMQYIDAAMVGQLGAQASASVGLVSSSIWLTTDLALAPVFGYSVLISHRAGANDAVDSRNVFRQGIKVSLITAGIFAVIGSALAFPLPAILGANQEIRHDASIYFLIVCLCLPMTNLGFYAMKSLQAVGDTKTPGLWSIARCFFNVVFNAFLIYGDFMVAGLHLKGAGLGVAGAALGTVLANTLVGFILLLIGAVREPFLRILR
ncbi:MAG: MATE family efflux transporter, partial [Firmicutes bacterium]|nr:MATE family efflux transporter [Bacillota bacterium]